MNGMEKKTMTTRTKMSSQPVGIAAASIHPMFDFVVNNSSTNDGAGGAGVVGFAITIVVVAVVVVVVVIFVVGSKNVVWFCLFRFEINVLKILEDDDIDDELNELFEIDDVLKVDA